MSLSGIRRPFRIAGFAALVAASLWGEPSNGYLYFGPGGYSCCHYTTGGLAFGAGGEYGIGKGFGAGAELGAVAMWRGFAGSVMGALSPNGYYHFKRGDTRRADPFVTGGYTLVFRSGHANLANFGGGLNYWFHRSLGFRLEFRDMLTTTGTTTHIWAFRFGVAFR